LVRAGLIRLKEEEHVLVLTVHHIVTDGWSMDVLAEELSSFYRAHCRAERPQMEELPIQYADYAEWQRKWLNGEVLERQLSYWREQLKGDLGILDLPTDHSRPAVQSFNGASQRFLLSRELSEQAQLVNRQEGATLFMTLLAVFSVLLARYS